MEQITRLLKELLERNIELYNVSNYDIELKDFINDIFITIDIDNETIEYVNTTTTSKLLVSIDKIINYQDIINILA